MATGKYNRWLTEEGRLLLEGWARQGLTDVQIADKCGINVATLYAWKNKHSEICEALKKGKEIIDIMVENALLKRALGYRYKEETYERQAVKASEDDEPADDNEKQIVLTKFVIKEVIPDTTAQIYWLKNRKRDIWKDNHDRAEIERDRLELERLRVSIEQKKADTEKNAITEVTIIMDEATKELMV